jgi:hypothetical protein
LTHFKKIMINFILIKQNLSGFSELQHSGSSESHTVNWLMIVAGFSDFCDCSNNKSDDDTCVVWWDAVTVTALDNVMYTYEVIINQ